MSRATEPRDHGFSLVEVVVAIGILTTLLVAVLPQLVGGIRATDTARRTTQAKALATSELERMRNLPYHVSPTAGPYVDLFDRYFRNTSAPTAAPACTDAQGRHVAPTTQSNGYVDGSRKRCDWEPTRPFYRTVRTAAQDSTLAGYVVVVDVQFLSSATPPAAVTPPATYDTQVDGRDAPPGQQAGITVTVLSAVPSDRTPVTTSTQVARSYAVSPRVQSLAKASALEVSTFTPDEVEVSLTASQLTLEGSLIASSRAVGVLSAAAASTGTGERGGAGQASLVAPPDATVSTVDGGDGSLDATGCALVCWGGTHLSDPVVVQASGGLPRIGSPAAPVEATIKEPSASGQALRFSAGSQAVYRPELDLDPPLVRLKDGALRSGTSSSCTVDSTGSNVRLAASGWLRTTATDDVGSPSVVDACATSRSAPVTILPTSFAPLGVIRVSLTRLSVRCVVSGAGHTPTTSVDYSATVQRWTPSGYVTIGTVTPSTSSDFLAAVDLTTTQVGSYGPLSRWIDSWSVLTSDRLVRTTYAGRAVVEVPAVVNVLTQPLRRESSGGVAVNDASGNPVVDEISTMSVTVGSAQCSAQDAR